MSEIFFTFYHGPRTLAAVLLIVALSVTDSYLTIELVSRGAEEVNPIMAYYLSKSPLLFFTVKYSVTSAAIMIVLSIKNNFIWGTKIHARFFLGIFFFAFALVIQWQLFLLYQLTD
jgi:hypothetical protein